MKGSCLCGTVTYEVGALSSPIGHCHCLTCQKAHSAAFTTTARVDRTAFNWLTGDGSRKSFESTPGKLRHFCGDCGSHLMAEWLDQDSVILRVASLDDDPGTKPVLHIFTSDDRSWLTEDDELPRYSERPA